MMRTIALLTGLLILPNTVSAASYPVLFVHGFCSSSSTWNVMFSHLPQRRFGDDLATLYRTGDGSVLVRNFPRTSHVSAFAVDFYNSSIGGFNATSVADVPIRLKVLELKAVIDHIKRATGESKVIIVSHSMGGLVARAYIQGIGYDATGSTIRYGGDVAATITIDTPHQGAGGAYVSTALGPCWAVDTSNKRELQPSSSFLNLLNGRNWVSDTALHSVVSFNRGDNGDDVVSIESQDMSSIPRYRGHPDILTWTQGFDGTSGTLHNQVLNEVTTAALVQGVVDDIDRVTATPSPSPPNCSTRSISTGQTLTGSLTDGDCSAPHRSFARADLHTFQGSSGQTVTISMVAGFDTYLLLVGPSGSVVAENDDADGTNSRLQVQLPSAGTYTIEATAYGSDDRGSYTLLLAGTSSSTPTPMPSSCSITSIAIGQTITGSLIESDCAAPHRNAARADRYTFQGSSGQAVTISMAANFDTYLLLVGPSGNVVAENDDSDGTNSRLQVQLPSTGTYTIEATAYGSDDRGSYTLTLAGTASATPAPAPPTAPPNCATTSISLPRTVTGTLLDSDCESRHRAGRRADLYALQGTAGQTITIVMVSSGFDTYLSLLNSSGALVADNDDFGNGTDSQISIRLSSTGIYVIEASAFSLSGRGSYSLSIR